MPDRVFNFSAGPAVLPLPVLERAREELLCLPGVGSSILEISHRSPAFDRILEETLGGLRDLLGTGPDHEIVFLQGGASLQFSMVPMNLLRGRGEPADYLLTGSWGVPHRLGRRRDQLRPAALGRGGQPLPGVGLRPHHEQRDHPGRAVAPGAGDGGRPADRRLFQ
jgi:hypothetical protein